MVHFLTGGAVYSGTVKLLKKASLEQVFVTLLVGICFLARSLNFFSLLAFTMAVVGSV